jgi:sugar phosphate isomerase/epimerase
MASRREFLTTATAALGTAALRPPSWAAAAAAGRAEIKSPLNGPIGLQLWSLREQLPKDLHGTLTKVREMGFREVEGAGLWKQSLAGFRAALDRAGLRCQSAHVGFERLRDDMAGAIAEVKGLGAAWVVTPWIPHDDKAGFTREDALKAATAFNGFGKALAGSGLRFGYHCHGYDSAPAAEGTLVDTIAKNTDPELVAFQIDVFHAHHGGAHPAALIERLAGRVVSLHLKDQKKGFPVEVGKGTAPAEADVPVGTGQIDWPAVLRAAQKAGARLYYVEDESTDPLGHIPTSVAYLEGLKL